MPQLSVICLTVFLMVIGEHIIFLFSPQWEVSTVRPLALGGFVFAAIILGLSALALDAWFYETVWVSVVGIALNVSGADSVAAKGTWLRGGQPPTGQDVSACSISPFMGPTVGWGDAGSEGGRLLHLWSQP